ncbi:hypothetical protein CFAM422_003926 [Trichoderma lentiforme]|uniref:Uncharacterized protein n=1 Tax=Trichoderma lentiforme TaxID=1567552 RepID=A0A9P4XHX8_9HYPO|nr:hypothetical protein CFAM422_003926 [Trichoderma lentiforme]
MSYCPKEGPQDTPRTLHRRAELVSFSQTHKVQEPTTHHLDEVFADRNMVFQLSFMTFIGTTFPLATLLSEATALEDAER